MQASARRVFVTGAGGGIGQALTEAFLEAGDVVVVADRNARALSALRKRTGIDLEGHVYDQADPTSIGSLVRAVGHVDVLVNNAGIILRKPLIESTAAEVTRVVAVDLVGPILLATGFARSMARKRRGVIINMSSQHAFASVAARGVYSSAKAGLVQFTRASAAEWMPRGVRVVGIAPGVTDTPMLAGSVVSADARSQLMRRIPLGRVGSPQEIARLAVFLASEAAELVVGQTVIADGGFVLA